MPVAGAAVVAAAAWEDKGGKEEEVEGSAACAGVEIMQVWKG